MNRSSRGAVKRGRPHSTDTRDFRSWQEEYEAIEAAVLQTPRGRWFLSEYLRRHQHEETRRLLRALRKLLKAQARASRNAGCTADVISLLPNMAASSPASHHGLAENSILESLRLLLARTADELAEALHGAPPAEPTLPEAAASRLALLLNEAGENPAVVPGIMTVLAGHFEQLARMLGEPQPLPSTEPMPEQELELPPRAAGAAPTDAARSAELTDGPSAPEAPQEAEPGPAAPSAAPAPAAPDGTPRTESRQVTPADTVTAGAGKAAASTTGSDERNQSSPTRPRIVIRRLERSSALDIPVPDAPSHKAPPSENGTCRNDSKDAKPPRQPEIAENSEEGKGEGETERKGGERRRKVVHLAPAR